MEKIRGLFLRCGGDDPGEATIGHKGNRLECRVYRSVNPLVGYERIDFSGTKPEVGEYQLVNDSGMRAAPSGVPGTDPRYREQVRGRTTRNPTYSVRLSLREPFFEEAGISRKF